MGLYKNNKEYYLSEFNSKDDCVKQLLGTPQELPMAIKATITLNEYLGEYCSPFAYEVAANKGRMKTLRSQKRWQKFQDERAKAYYTERERRIKEYHIKYGYPKINKYKELIDSANGNPDNASVQAARRLCHKKGINWKINPK